MYYEERGIKYRMIPNYGIKLVNEWSKSLLHYVIRTNLKGKVASYPRITERSC